jgi:hypothetical protein
MAAVLAGVSRLAGLVKQVYGADVEVKASSPAVAGESAHLRFRVNEKRGIPPEPEDRARAIVEALSRWQSSSGP